MRLAHRVSLGGVQLDSLDGRIIIKGVEGGSGKETVTTAGTGRGDGTRITGKRRDSMEVAVKFSMNIRRDSIGERNELLEEINAWAVKGGWLKINYKAGRQLYVDEVTTPGEGDLWKRLNEYTITFRAHAVPYWVESDEQSVTTKSAASASGTLPVAGSATTVADVTLENMSGALINKATLNAGGSQMKFTDLGLAANERLVIDHVITQGKNVIRIRIRSATGAYRSAMAKRTDGSADEFELAPGNCSVSFDADRSCRMTVSCRGRFV